MLVFVDQKSDTAAHKPRELRMWATVSTVRDGDEWLISGVETES